MARVNYHKMALKYITRGFDRREVLRVIAIDNPAVFCKAVERVYGKKTDFNTEVKILVDAGRKIDAIKLYRQNVKCSLKDAKDYVDRL